VGLSDLYCTPARAHIERHGGTFVEHSIAEALELAGDGAVAAVRLRDGSRLEASYFVAAVPAPQMMRMLPASAVADRFFARCAELSSSPIICVHAWFDREITRSAFVGFIGTATQWLFNKRRIFERRGEHHAGYLSFVISGARGLVHRSNDELLNM